MIQRQKGCNDIYGREAKVWKYIDTVIDAMMEKYNYNYIRTPIFEATELFHRGVGETTDIVTKESYDFEDKGGRKITLRPEGTAGVVRSFIENKMYGDPNQPVKVYYNVANRVGPSSLSAALMGSCSADESESCGWRPAPAEPHKEKNQDLFMQQVFALKGGLLSCLRTQATPDSSSPRPSAGNTGGWRWASSRRRRC